MVAVWALAATVGCAGPGLRSLDAADGRLARAIFEPGPSEDRFESSEGFVTRVRSAADADGVWTSLTTGPGESSELTLRREDGRGVVLLRLVSDGREVICDNGLAIEPGDGVLPFADEGACTIDGRSGTARSLLEPGEEPGTVRLTLEFRAAPAVVRRRFDWRTDPDGRIESELAELRVTVLGLPVRSWSRAMRRAEDR